MAEEINKTKNYGFPIILPCYGFYFSDINSAFEKMDTLPIYTKKVDISKQTYDNPLQQSPTNPVTFTWHCEIGYDGYGNHVFKAHTSIVLETASNLAVSSPYRMLGSNIQSATLYIPGPINSDDIPGISTFSIRGTVGSTGRDYYTDHISRSIAFSNRLAGNSIRAWVVGYNQSSSTPKEQYKDPHQVHISIEMKGVINDDANP